MATAPVDDQRRNYGSKITAVEPGGAEPIPLTERHGKAHQQTWIWTSPNMEFATVFVGVLAVLVFGLSFWTAVAAIVLGNAVGAVFHGTLTSWGPLSGLGQMALGRKAFGFRGNVLPAGLNAFLGGLGWLAVNSISGALAFSTLTGLSPYLCLVLAMIVTLGIAFFGHNVVQLFERVTFPVLTVIFAAGIVVVLTQTRPDVVGDPVPGAFWIIASSAFGLTGGWCTCGADYARYLRPDQHARAGFFAALGNFTSATVLQIGGAAAVTAVGIPAWNDADPVASYVSLMPGWLGEVTLLGVFIGALSANSLNLYSSSLSLAAMGIKLPTAFGRAIIALVMGLLGLALGMLLVDDVNQLSDFLLVVSYWTAPWIGVVLADRLLSPRPADDLTPYTDRRHRNWAGPVAMVVAAVVSVALFSNQDLYVGPVPSAFPGVGDLTLAVGLVLAFLLYAVLRPRGGRARSAVTGLPRQRDVATAERGTAAPETTSAASHRPE
jgi:nucleobase:cation symporter-1, NCS1 family